MMKSNQAFPSRAATGPLDPRAGHGPKSTSGRGGAPAADRTLYSLQALRFIAAALVVISHIRTEFRLTPFGSSGVDVFFVISGFIIHYVTREGVS